MSTTRVLRPFGLLMAMTSLVVGAEPAPKCGKIAQDVTESITKEPAKVLMIVEDALVINEGCACEIIKAAITASKADVPMVKQIIATAVAVAPKMTPVIMECANATSPGSTDEVTTASVVEDPSGKDAKSVQPVTVEEPKTSGSDFSGSASIRGVYLMAPAVGGLISAPVPEEEEDSEPEDKPRKRKHRHTPQPMSPSCTCPSNG